MINNLFKLYFFFALFLCGCPKTTNDIKNDIKKNPVEEKPSQNIDYKNEYFESNLKLLKLHNKQREYKGRVGLDLDKTLINYAQKHAEWMARKNNLNHSDISVLMGKYHTAGENIAWNQEDEEEVTNSWMNSSGHRANILNRSFSKVGFGVASAKDGSLYWCTVFGD